MHGIEVFIPTTGQRRSVLGPLDAALDYLRMRAGRVLPVYVLAMTPLAVAMLGAIDVVSAQRRSAVGSVAWLVTAAMVWRWGWLSLLQKRVQEDLRGQAVGPLYKQALVIVWIRLACFVLITWGSVLVVPAFYGWFVSAFAAPMLLASGGRSWPRIVRAVRWTHRSAGRLIRLSGALGLGAMLCLGVVLGTQYLLVHLLAPGVMGLDTASMQLTLGSYAAKLATCFGLFAVLDFYWSVASVILFYDLQGRRLGSDLRQRIAAMALERST